MLSNHRKCIAALVAIVGLIVLVSGCGNKASQGGAETRIPVYTAPVVRADLTLTRSYSGTVEGNRQATVYARVPETVKRLFVSEGHAITKGAQILEFDESGPSSTLRQARAVADDARKTADKYQRLYEQGAVSELERDAMQTQSDVAQANFEAAKEQINVTAPISGVVTEVYARVGRQLNVGQPIALIAAIDTVRVLVNVSIYESKDIHAGQKVTVRSEMDTTLVAHGWVDKVPVSADVQSRNLAIEVLAENPGHRLLPGLFVRAIFEFSSRDNVPAIPRDALVYRQSGLGVFVIQDSTAHYVPVTIGIESGAQVELLDGPEPGAEVVTLGQSNLQDGTKVTATAETTTQSTTTATP